MAAINAGLRVSHGVARFSAQPRKAARRQIRQVVHVGSVLCGVLQPAANRQNLGGTRRREVDPGSLVAESPAGSPDCRTDLELAGASAAKGHNARISGLATIMRLLDRYIARRVFRGYALIMVILVSAFSLIALVHELDSVGKGTYSDFRCGVVCPVDVAGMDGGAVTSDGALGSDRRVGRISGRRGAYRHASPVRLPGAHCLVGAENRAACDARGYGLAGVRGSEVGPIGF